ncbi:MAG: class I SAM-dependent methyltransferase family protein [Methanobacteriota archaeon]|nr:MAG: class I SAM-dependent methyltransferase family protein [Euryarchaeota archaeon]
MPVLAVARERAEDLLQELMALQLVDETRKITKSGREILIPVVGEPPIPLARHGARWKTDERLPSRSPARNPRDRLDERLRAAGIPLAIAPRRWKRLGDVVILRILPGAQAHARAMAEIYGSVLGARTVVQDISGIHGPLRLPDFEVLWGDGTETVYLEGGVRYAFDVARVMLSPGNIKERLAITNRVRPGAVVADLFAGIGYFTLPLALRSHPEIVYACELNPISFQYLVRNIRLNRATNVVPLLGDCRDVMPRGVADWVIMGHFDAREYLDVAFAVLRTRGTIVYHELCPKEQFPDALARRLAAATRANWRNVTQMHTRIVKSYAPGIVHAVAEFEVSPRHRM